MIQPLTRPEWKYISSQYLATSGIYTSDDLNKLRLHIMEPAEKPAVPNTLPKGNKWTTHSEGPNFTITI